MDKNLVSEFVESNFEDFLSAMVDSSEFAGMQVEYMNNFDDVFAGNSFRTMYEMVVQNDIDIAYDEYLVELNGTWVGYPSSDVSIKDFYVDKITSQLLDRKCKVWDDPAYNIETDELSVAKIRESLNQKKKFKVELKVALKTIEVEAVDSDEAAVLAMEEFDYPHSNISEFLQAGVWDEYGDFEGIGF